MKINFLILLLMFNAIQGFNFENVNTDLLKKALTIASGGSNNKSYYHVYIDGQRFGGERSFEDRWNLISKINFANKRVLDIGCNIGIYSAFLLKYANAHSAIGIDRPDEKLIENYSPKMLDAAKMLQSALGVHMNILQIDLNNSDYENIIGQKFDTVICMSIFKWINDKKRFLKFLSQFNEMLYEGHDTDEIEIQRFKEIGFGKSKILGKTQIGVSYPNDQCRTLIYFTK